MRLPKRFAPFVLVMGAYFAVATIAFGAVFDRVFEGAWPQQRLRSYFIALFVGFVCATLYWEKRRRAAQG